MGFINKLTRCFQCAEKKAPQKQDLEPVLHFFPYPHIEMEPSMRLNYVYQDDDDDDDDPPQLEKAQSMTTFFSHMQPKWIIHHYVVKYYHWQIALWKKRLHYPYSLYAAAGIVGTYMFIHFLKK